MAEEEVKMENDMSEEQRRAQGIEDMNRAEGGGGGGRKKCSNGS